MTRMVVTIGVIASLLIGVATPALARTESSSA